MPLPLFLALTLPAFFFALLANIMLGPLLVDLARDFQSTVAVMGQLAAVTSLPWAVLAPLAGPFSDRYGRRPLLLIGLGVTGVAVSASGFAWDYASLAALRFLTGVGASLIPPNCVAAVSDHVSPERRGYAISLMLTVFSLGALVGVPAVAYVAALGGWQASFLMVGAALALVFLIFLFLFPGAVPRKDSAQGEGFDYAGYFAPLRASRRPWMLLAANFTERTSVTLALTYVAAFFIQTYGLSLGEVAPALSVVAFGMLLGAVAGGPLTTARSRLKVCAGAQAATGLAGLALFGTSPGFLASVAISGALGLFTTLGRPTIMALVVDVAPASRGTMTGLYATSNQTATIAAAALGGLMIGLGGYQTVGVLALAAGLAGAVIAGWFIGEKSSGEMA